MLLGADRRDLDHRLLPGCAGTRLSLHGLAVPGRGESLVFRRLQTRWPLIALRPGIVPCVPGFLGNHRRGHGRPDLDFAVSLRVVYQVSGSAVRYAVLMKAAGSRARTVASAIAARAPPNHCSLA